MTLDEVIKHAEEVAKENQRVVDTKDVTIDMLFCDDAEIEERLEKYQKTADNYRQIAEWLKDYRQLKSAVENIKSELESDVMKFNKRPEISYDTAFSDGIEHALTVIDNHIIEKEQN